MRLIPGPVVIVMSLVSACSSLQSEKRLVALKPTQGASPSASPARRLDPPVTFELLRADTPRTTARGTSFVAPKAWRIGRRDVATILEPPEAGNAIALIDVDAKDADGAAMPRGPPTARPDASSRCPSSPHR